jgi:dienelactone hydrolase
MIRQLIGLISIVWIVISCSKPEPTPEISTPTATPNVDIFYDVSYVEPFQANDDGYKLDIYKPLQSGNWPVIVLLHGLPGTKEGFKHEAPALAEHGMVVVVPNFPNWLIDMAARDEGKGFREMQEVLACAIRFARNKAADYEGDPSFLTLAGFSFGGMIGSEMALIGDKLDALWDEFAESSGGPASHIKCVVQAGSSKVDAFIGIGGPYNITNKIRDIDPELWQLVDPFALVGIGDRLVIRLLHGASDQRVNPEPGKRLNEALTASGYDSRLIMYDGGHEVPVDLTAELILELAER